MWRLHQLTPTQYPFSVIEYVTPAPTDLSAAPARVIEYVTAAVIKDATPAPADTYATPVPLIDHVMPALVVIHTAPVTEDESPAPPAPVVEYIAPAPSVTISTPSQQFPPAHTMATVTTSVSLDTPRRQPRIQWKSLSRAPRRPAATVSISSRTCPTHAQSSSLLFDYSD